MGAATNAASADLMMMAHQQQQSQQHQQQQQQQQQQQHQQQHQQQQQPNQKYNLRWHDYPQSVVTSFRNLKEEEDFVDVTLACNSQQFTAHKVVLSACSPYFRKLLKTNPCQHPIVILRDVTEADLRCLLKFMYHGEVQVDEEHLKDFLKTAETLQVRGLAEGSATAIPANEDDDIEEHSSGICSEEDRLMLRRRRHLRRRNNNEAEDENENATTTSSREQCQKTSSTSAITTTMDQDSACETSTPGLERNNGLENLFGSGSTKRIRLDGEGGSPLPSSVSPPPPSSYRNMMDIDRKENNNTTSKESLLSQALEKPAMVNALGSFMSSAGNGGGRSTSDGHDDSGASDTGSERPESMLDGSIKADSNMDLHRQLSSPAAAAAAAQAAAAGLFPPGLEALYRQAGFPSAFLGLGGAGSGGSSGHHGGSNSNSVYPVTTHVGLQSHANNPSIGGKLDMMRVRATDPRPCPKCGKVYRSAHTLRTHMEDKHTVCPGYRCVLCGTVAKSRNSLHSHMSRQHRGISTKDLPVLPMPSPFDADLASRLLAKAGVKVSPGELAARASPTAPRRSDLPKLDGSLLHMNSQQFPLPASMPPASVAAAAAAMMHNHSVSEGGRHDPEDLRIPTSSPFGAHMRGSMGHMGSTAAAAAAAAAAAQSAAAASGGMGSALLDTYLSMIAAAGGDSSMAAALTSFPGAAGRAAAFAAAAHAASSSNHPNPTKEVAPANNSTTTNGDGGKDVSESGRSISEDRDDEDRGGELGSDADISDTEEANNSSNKPDDADDVDD